MGYRVPRGDGVRDRRARSLSGPNIPEAERHTKRVRISTLSYVLAMKMAGATGSVAEVIEDLLVTFASENDQRAEAEDHPEDDRGREGKAR